MLDKEGRVEPEDQEPTEDSTPVKTPERPFFEAYSVNLFCNVVNLFHNVVRLDQISNS